MLSGVRSSSEISNGRFGNEGERLKIGDRVVVDGLRLGVIKYLGPVGTKRNLVCGIELDGPWGNTNGTRAGKVYFQCAIGYGVFRDANEVRKYRANDYNQTGMLSREPAESVDEKEEKEERGVKELLDENVEIQRLVEGLRKENNELTMALAAERQTSERLRGEVGRLEGELGKRRRDELGGGNGLGCGCMKKEEVVSVGERSSKVGEGWRGKLLDGLGKSGGNGVGVGRTAQVIVMELLNEVKDKIETERILLGG
ncbi:hypothetical protein NEHOM01_0467 [Nematocida homosporus]|uniref:uncharacterized protein n=1 Tax=Nematocida homosporus TaxID=1912981 RepID=UPI00221E6510|nr:uncharacterized protein NEHOM01_0467 [Nematocida homosporus]KAI5184916.1 hypothetical protein NEHOM01_0467 [Nematocida homosporus]